MTNENLFKKIGEIDDDLIGQANTLPIKKSIHTKRWLALAACFALIFALGIPTITLNVKNQIKLENSQNAKAKYVNKAPVVAASDSLIPLNEDELFTKFNLTIFKGKIIEIRNIQVSYNGSLDYRAIAKIEIQKVYKASNKIGDVVSVLLPCPIDSNVKVSDTNVVSSMREGMSGIFMPMIYDETSIRSENNASVCLLDLAEYGFADGERFAFLETENGLVFDKDSHKSISTATNINEVENYITQKIK